MITISSAFLYSLYAIIIILALPYFFLIVGIIKMKKRAKFISKQAIPQQDSNENGNDFLDFINEISHAQKNNSSKKS